MFVLAKFFSIPQPPSLEESIILWQRNVVSLDVTQFWAVPNLDDNMVVILLLVVSETDPYNIRSLSAPEKATSLLK